MAQQSQDLRRLAVEIRMHQLTPRRMQPSKHTLAIDNVVAQMMRPVRTNRGPLCFVLFKPFLHTRSSFACP